MHKLIIIPCDFSDIFARSKYFVFSIIKLCQYKFLFINLLIFTFRFVVCFTTIFIVTYTNPRSSDDTIAGLTLFVNVSITKSTVSQSLIFTQLSKHNEVLQKNMLFLSLKTFQVVEEREPGVFVLFLHIVRINT